MNDKTYSLLFEELFLKHYKALHFHIYTIVRNEEVTEDIIQDIFLELWNRKEKIDFSFPIRGYLIRCATNLSLNHIGSLNYLSRAELPIEVEFNDMLWNQEDEYSCRELAELLNRSVNTLPPQCKEVFQLSRKKNLTNKEISSRLNINIKTVEKHITKALKIIRGHLSKEGFTTLLIFFYLIWHRIF